MTKKRYYNSLVSYPKAKTTQNGNQASELYASKSLIELTNILMNSVAPATE